MRRLYIVFFVLAGIAPSAFCDFRIGLNEGRSPIAAVAIASINIRGIVFSPAPGVAGIRYSWTDFSAEGLMELQRVLPRERAFQQKPGADKVGYLQLISSRLNMIAPQKPAVPNPLPVEPKLPPVKIKEAPPVPSIRLPDAPTITAPPAASEKEPESKPDTKSQTGFNFELIHPLGVSNLSKNRPSYGGAFAALFTPAGIFLVLVMMGFSVYAGNEIARFRHRPKGLVCAISAIFPVIGPAIFLLLPDPASKFADKMAEASDPFLIKQPDNPAAVETEVPPQTPKVQCEEDLYSPHLGLDQDLEETHLESAPQFPPGEATLLRHHKLAGSATRGMELYRAPEYLFDYEFFNQFFNRFINAQPSDGQALILRTHDLEYPVHYISQLYPNGVSVIYPSGDEWLEDTIEYEALEEVEVTVLKS